MLSSAFVPLFIVLVNVQSSQCIVVKPIKDNAFGTTDEIDWLIGVNESHASVVFIFRFQWIHHTRNCGHNSRIVTLTRATNSIERNNNNDQREKKDTLKTQTKQTQPIVNTHTHAEFILKKSSSEDGLSVVKQHTQKRREGQNTSVQFYQNLYVSIRFSLSLSLQSKSTSFCVCLFQFWRRSVCSHTTQHPKLCARVCECGVQPSHSHRQA